MGRYYTGTISGKFWFGIQDSYDASNFKNSLIKPLPYYVYYVCGCDVKNNDEYYCYDCFCDYDAHFNSINYDDKLALESELLAFKLNHVKYNFDISDLEFINTKLEELENIIGRDIINNLEFKTDDEENYFEYYLNYSALDNIIEDSIIKIIARWCLGKQIQTAIINAGYCYMDCEL